MSRDRTAELLPTENMMSTSPAMGWQPGCIFLFLILPVVQTSGSVSPHCLVCLDREMCKAQPLHLLYNINAIVPEGSAVPTHNWFLSRMTEGRESLNTILPMDLQARNRRNQILQVQKVTRRKRPSSHTAIRRKKQRDYFGSFIWILNKSSKNCWKENNTANSFSEEKKRFCE